MKIVGLQALQLMMAAAFVMGRKYMSEKPDALSPCKQLDSNFNECLANNLLILTNQWKDGVPGLPSLGSFDPLRVKKARIAQDAGSPVNLQIDLSDLVITGFAQSQIAQLNYDAQKRLLALEIFLPKLNFDFTYKLNGRILQLPLNGSGKGRFEADKIAFLMATKVNLVEEHNHIFSDIVELKMQIKDPGNFHMDLSNLFNGDKALQDSTLMLLNDNWREVYQAMRPSIEKAMHAIHLKRLKAIFAYVPIDYFIADLAPN